MRARSNRSPGAIPWRSSDSARSSTPANDARYCSNVHPGSSLGQVLQGLERHAVGVHERLGGDARLPLGLWLGADALDDAGRFGVQRLRDWLGERSLRVFAMNGFPFGDFHHEVVKHDVYRPDWTDDARTHYTLGLAELLAGLLDAGESGSVSTVPLGWGAALDEHEVAVCAERLRALCAGLEELEDRTGRCIHVDLEPEPGCAIERLDGLASFFERHLLGGSDEARVRRHLRACVDCCHAAVMYEDFARGLEALDDPRSASAGCRCRTPWRSTCTRTPTPVGRPWRPSAIRDGCTRSWSATGRRSVP